MERKSGQGTRKVGKGEGERGRGRGDARREIGKEEGPLSFLRVFYKQALLHNRFRAATL